MKQSTLFSILSFLRRNYILILFMAFFAAWSSCSKDLSPLPIETRSIVANYNENPLFDTSSLLLSRIYQDLHTKNTADSFLNYLYETYGSFVWQASFIQKTSDSLPLMIVPLVRNNDVTALLFVQPMSNNRYIYNLVDRDYIVNNNALTSGTGLSKKLAYTRLYLLNTFRKNLFCLVDSSYVLYGNAIRDSLELEERYDIKMPMLIWEECCPPETRGCYSIGGSWGKFVWGYFVLHYPDIPSGSNNGFGHNDDFNYTGGGNIWDPHSGQGGGSGGGGDPLSGLGFYVKKQLKSHLLKLKTVYGFSQSIEQLLPMVYSCYTIDPDFDEVTFDDDCAIAGIASRYLDAIQYSGNYAIAVGWLSGHVSDLVALMDHVEDHVQETGIKSYHGAMLDLLDNNEGYVRQRFFELWDAIEADPHVLLRPCVEQNTSYPYTFWSDLYNFQPDQSTISALASRGFTYQPLQEGNAVATSVDYYYVEIAQMPDFNGDGSPDSEQQVIDVLRANFAGLASGVKNGFQFSCPLPPWHNNPDNIWWEFKPYTTGIDNVQWSYPAPTYKNTIFFIDAGAEDQNNNEFADKGAIIISQASPCCWIGSTINTPLSGSQPFSGQRQWGLATLPNGKKAFYTKAADRALTESWLPTIAGEIWKGCDDDTYYNIAHETWKNLMLKAGAFINQFGGQVFSEPGYSEPAINITKARINYNELDGKLKSNTPVNFISCE